MNPEQIQPDYNFILNQQQPEPKKSKKSGLLFAAVIGVGILAVITIFATAFMRMQPRSPREVAGTDDPAGAFMTYMQQDEPASEDDIYQLLGTPLSSNKAFESIALQRLKTTINFKSCQKDAQSTPAAVRYQCQNKLGDTLTLLVTVEGQNGKQLITAHRIEANA